MESKRICYFDYSKGILIFLVVLGHCISYGCGANYMNKELYYSNWLYKIIYTFHMPAFALISGYFIWHSMQKFQSEEFRLLPFLRDKAIHLLLPLAIYRLLYYLYDLCFLRSFTWKG